MTTIPQNTDLIEDLCNQGKVADQQRVRERLELLVMLDSGLLLSPACGVRRASADRLNRMMQDSSSNEEDTPDR